MPSVCASSPGNAMSRAWQEEKIVCTSTKALKTMAHSGNCLQLPMTEVYGKRGEKPGDDV